MNSAPFPKNERNTVIRAPKRAHYDRKTVYAVLDATPVCHVGFVVHGQPFVIPTIYGRSGDQLYIHGAAASRMLRELRQGIAACITVTLIDGLVLARSAFHHSMNYRSAMLFGALRELEDVDAKNEGLRVIMDHMMRGRREDVRAPTPQELKATSVCVLELEEASAKIRTGGPNDDVEDYALPCWAGVIPLTVQPGVPVNDEKLRQGIGVPGYVQEYIGHRGTENTEKNLR